MNRVQFIPPGCVLHLPRSADPLVSVGYCGMLDEDGEAWVSSYQFGRWRPLPLCLRIRSHSPTGFAWGYSGSGPAQLALAILCHATRNQELSLELYQIFKRKVIARLNRRRWHLSQEFVRAWVRERFEQPELLDLATFCVVEDAS